MVDRNEQKQNGARDQKRSVKSGVARRSSVSRGSAPAKEMKRQTWKKKSRRQRKESRYQQKVISIRRVAKTRRGSKRLRFSAVVVVGDERGKVGVGLGRGRDTRLAVEKAVKVAEREMKNVAIVKGTVPHEITHKKGAAKIFIGPAAPGTGVIAGGPVRAVLEVAGIKNVLTKVLGSSNQINNAYCAFEALGRMKSVRLGNGKPVETLRLRGEKTGSRTEKKAEKITKTNKSDRVKKTKK